MNYFAHGRRFVADPYFLAGTAVPDWLSAFDRRVRVRSKHATQFTGDDDPRVAALAAGIVQHHHDDGWFHETRAFSDLSLEFTARIRDLLPQDEGFRPSFLGHILVELLLDDTLMATEPEMAEAYYEALGQVDPALVQASVNRMAPRETECLRPLIPRFCAARFLFDYRDDGKLWNRLNQVMQRVRLPALPEEFCRVLPAARAAVAARADELLASPGR